MIHVEGDTKDDYEIGRNVLGLSVRSKNGLLKQGILDIETLCTTPIKELMKGDNIGATSALEIAEAVRLELLRVRPRAKPDPTQLDRIERLLNDLGMLIVKP